MLCVHVMCESLFPVSQHFCLNQEEFELWGLDEEEEERGKSQQKAYSAVFLVLTSVSGYLKGNS